MQYYIVLLHEVLCNSGVISSSYNSFLKGNITGKSYLYLSNKWYVVIITALLKFVL